MSFLRAACSPLTACLAVFLMLMSVAPVNAQTVGIQPQVAATSDPIQSPAEFLGYELGERFTFHHRVVAYFEHVAGKSPYATLEYYGESIEGRPLLVAYISSPQNLGNLEDIRTNNLRRTGLAEGDYTPDGKAILWMSYNIHGNEAASIEASMQTLYELAGNPDNETKSWLENTVVIMDPALNPDGSERYAVWFNQVVGRHFDPYPLSREHREPSPNGRLNHYHYDLNRDWAWHTQHETRLRNAIYQRWLPHVHADFHEMGGYRYFFAPAADPFHTSITDWQKSFQTTIGENHARYFDEKNRLYFTGEIFDLFYPSYGDTWPTFQGAIGMTYEQGGSWGAGLGVTTEEGHIHTLKHRISNQHRVGMSTVEVVARHHQQVSDEFRKYYQNSINNPAVRYKSYILRPDGNPDNTRALLQLLEAHKIQFGRAPARRNLNAYNYHTGSTERISTTEGDILISMHQPKSVLANVLLEPRTTIVDSLTYDITAWSLPFAYGVQAFASEERLVPHGNAFDVLDRMQIMGFPDPVYAYVFEWNSFEDARFLAALHREEIRVRIASEPMRIGEARFGRGAMVITHHNNDHVDNFDQTIRQLADNHNRIPFASGTGMISTGLDLGSETVQFAKAPKVATFSGDGVQGGAFGEVWHFFDEVLEYPITVIDMSRASELNLHDFDVLILPQGRYDELLGSSAYERLHDWVSRGGRLIAMEGVLNQLSGKRGLDGLRSRESAQEDRSNEQRLRVYGDRRRDSRTNVVAGSIFRVQLDNTHPLAFGYPDYYYTLKRRTGGWEFMDRGWNVGFIRDEAHVSGFTGYRAFQSLEDTMIFGAIPVGRGQVIVMSDNPLFRGFWYNGRLLFSNAVFQPM